MFSKTTIQIAADIEARSQSPLAMEAAKARTEQFNARMQNLWPRMNSLAQQAMRANSTATKLALLRELTDIMQSGAEGIAPCRKGCAGCCHVAVTITADEAALIGAEIKRKPKKPAKPLTKADAEDTAMEHYGKPCPFLSDGRCSIYASRPLACRTLFSMDADALLCTPVPGAPPKTFYLDYSQITQVIALAFIKSHANTADIRDFFPTGLKK